MRVLSVLLAVSMGLGPTVQAYAKALSEAHCRTQGLISMPAPDATHDAMHAAHHGHAGAANSDPAPAHGGHDMSHAEQCKCGCLCGHAGVISAAIQTSFCFMDAPLPDHFDAVTQAAWIQSVHSAPLRPPAVFS